MKDSLLLNPSSRAASTNSSLGSQSSQDRQRNETPEKKRGDSESFSKEYDKAVDSDQPTQINLSKITGKQSGQSENEVLSKALNSEGVLLKQTDNVEDVSYFTAIKDIKLLDVELEASAETETTLQTVKLEDTSFIQDQLPVTTKDIKLLDAELEVSAEIETTLQTVKLEDTTFRQSQLPTTITPQDNTKDDISSVLQTTKSGDPLLAKGDKPDTELTVINQDSLVVSDNKETFLNAKETSNDLNRIKSTPLLDTSSSTSASPNTDTITENDLPLVIKTEGEKIALENQQIVSQDEQIVLKTDNTLNSQQAQITITPIRPSPVREAENVTPIATDAESKQFGTTVSQTQIFTNTTGLTSSQNTLLSTDNALTAEADTTTQTEIEAIDTESVELETLETDMMEFDENDVFIKREALQAIGASLSSSIAGPVTLDTTTPNILNSNFSFGAGETQLRGMTSITMPPSAPIATTAHSNAVINTVSQAMLIAKETSQGVTVQLDPPEMGRVYIDFTFESDSQVNVVVKSDTLSSHDLLRERADQFTQMLKDNGFENIDLSFEQQDSTNGQADRQEDDSNFGENNRIIAEVKETQDKAYNSAIYTSNQDDLRLDLKL